MARGYKKSIQATPELKRALVARLRQLIQEEPTVTINALAKRVCDDEGSGASYRQLRSKWVYGKSIGPRGNPAFGKEIKNDGSGKSRKQHRRRREGNLAPAQPFGTMPVGGAKFLVTWYIGNVFCYEPTGNIDASLTRYAQQINSPGVSSVGLWEERHVKLVVRASLDDGSDAGTSTSPVQPPQNGIIATHVLGTGSQIT